MSFSGPSLARRKLPFVAPRRGSLAARGLAEASARELGHDTARHRAGHDITRHGTARHYATRHGTTLHDTTRHEITRHDTTRHDTTRHDTTRHGTTLHDTTRQLGPRRLPSPTGLATRLVRFTSTATAATVSPAAWTARGQQAPGSRVPGLLAGSGGVHSRRRSRCLRQDNTTSTVWRRLGPVRRPGGGANCGMGVRGGAGNKASNNLRKVTGDAPRAPQAAALAPVLGGRRAGGRGGQGHLRLWQKLCAAKYVRAGMGAGCAGGPRGEVTVRP